MTNTMRHAPAVKERITNEFSVLAKTEHDNVCTTQADTDLLPYIPYCHHVTGFCMLCNSPIFVWEPSAPLDNGFTGHLDCCLKTV